MKNPFTLIKDKVMDKIHNRKMQAGLDKQAGTKVETARSKSSGGRSASSVITEKNYDMTDINILHNRGRSWIKKVARRRMRNKMARKSRRINRLKKVA